MSRIFSPLEILTSHSVPELQSENGELVALVDVLNSQLQERREVGRQQVVAVLTELE